MEYEERLSNALNYDMAVSDCSDWNVSHFVQRLTGCQKRKDY